MTTPNTPIVNAGVSYINGLTLSKTAAKVVLLTSGAARDANNTNDIILPADVSINGAIVGAGGVDVAALVANTAYTVYVIGDSTGNHPTAGLLSLIPNAINLVNLPVGYDMVRRVGYIRTDGSANILQFYQYGRGQDRTYYYDVGVSVLSGGASTTFAAVDLSAAIPHVATQVLLDILFTPDGATEVAEFLPFGSSASNGIVRFGTGVAGAQVGSIMVPCALNATAPEILYKVASGDTLTLLVTGFVDHFA